MFITLTKNKFRTKIFVFVPLKSGVKFLLDREQRNDACFYPLCMRRYFPFENCFFVNIDLTFSLFRQEKTNEINIKYVKENCI